MNNYIIRQKDGTLWHFYFKNGVGICARKKSSSYWEDREIVFKDGEYDFTVMCDDDDNLHIICQNNSSNIYYFVYRSGAWQKYTILKSKTERFYPKNFKMIQSGVVLNLFYVIEHQEKYLLVHHMLDNESNPVVIDTLSQNTFSITCDDSYNIYIYYKNESGMSGYRTYCWSSKKISSFITIADDSCEIKNLCPLCDGIINHIVYVRDGSIVYRQKSESDFSSEASIYSSKGRMDAPAIAQTDDKLWILWCEYNKITYVTSTDAGKSWSKPVQFLTRGEFDVFDVQMGDRFMRTYGYEKQNDIHLFAVQDFIGKNVVKIKKETGIKIPGSDVEVFAKKHAFSETEERPQFKVPEGSSSDIKKLKIMIDILRREVGELKGQVARLNKKLGTDLVKK